MRVFQRDNKFYVGPVTDQEIEILLSRKDLSSLAGIACQAAGKHVDTYVTLPADRIKRSEIEAMSGALT